MSTISWNLVPKIRDAPRLAGVSGGNDEKTIGFGGNDFQTNSFRSKCPEQLDRAEIAASEACRAVVGFCFLHEINAEPGISSEVGKSVKVNVCVLFLNAVESIRFNTQDREECSIYFLFPRCSKFRKRTGPRFLALRKFAASPAVVVLCGMAAGAGFGSLENVQYIAKVGRLKRRSRFIVVTKMNTNWMIDSQNHPKYSFKIQNLWSMFDADLDPF